MTNWSDANNWIDLVDHVWIGLVWIATVTIPALIALKGTRKGLKKITDQVVNGHEDAPPLRADVNKVIARQSDVIKHQNELSEKVDLLIVGVADLREGLLDEEARHRSSVREMRDDFDRKFSDLLQRLLK